ncbi:hypothetical protein AB0B67_44280, partial [Streptomyces spectabilis]
QEWQSEGPVGVLTCQLQLAARLGPALYTSPHWLWNEGLRLLALTGWRAATEPEPAAGPAAGQEAWLLRLGGGAAPAA